VSAVSEANELAAQPSNSLEVAVSFQKPSTFPNSTCIDLLQAIHVRYIVQQPHVLLAHSSVFVYALVVARPVLVLQQQHRRSSSPRPNYISTFQYPLPC